MAGILDQPHHDGSELYVSDGVPHLGDTVAVFARVPDSFPVEAVHLRSAPDGEETFTEAVLDRRTDGESWWRADLPVRNPSNRYRFLLHTPDGPTWLHAGGTTAYDTPHTTDWRLTTHGGAPDWAVDAVGYQILPDRFARGGTDAPWPSWAAPADWSDPVIRGGQAAMDQLYGGDLWGVRDHLDHLTALGVDLVWLNPVFEAASNHRYNASSFDRIDPVLGGEQALQALLDAAHERGIRVVGDLTPNHTGDTHDWFTAAQSDADSPEAGFYFFRDHPDVYDAWAGVPTLPELDHTDAELRRRLWDGPRSVVARWLEFGLDGWRIDVAHTTGRHGAIELNDEVAAGIRRTLDDARPDGYLVAEHFFDPHEVLTGRGWHGVMNYAGFTAQLWSWLRADDLVDPATGATLPLLERPYPIPRWDGRRVVASLDAFRSVLPWQATLANWHLLDSHDTPRFRTVAGSSGRQLAGVALQMTLPGIPVVAAGDEVGIEGWDHEDARKPMPWDPADWDHEILAGYRDLIGLRRAHPALRRGGLRWAHVGRDVLVYLRETVDERLLVSVARDSHEPVRLPSARLGCNHGRDLHGGTDLRARDGWFTLPSDGPAVQVWSLGR